MQGKEDDMKDEIAQVTASHANDWVLLLMVGLGVSTIPAVEFFGGLFLAIAAALFAWKLFPESDRRKFYLVILAGFFAGWAGSFPMEYFAPQYPVQLGMAACGFTSKVIANILYRMAGQIDSRSKDITDKIVDNYLPGGDDK